MAALIVRCNEARDAAMSLDLFLVCLRNGEPAAFKRAIFDDIFGPHIVSADKSFVRVRFPGDREPKLSGNGCDVVDMSTIDGSDIYVGEGDEIDNAGFNHFQGEGFFEALYELARRTGSLIFWPAEGPSLAVTDEATLKHLPAGLLESDGPAQIVGSGRELEEYLSAHS
jgi:hypothetical protein